MVPFGRAPWRDSGLAVPQRPLRNPPPVVPSSLDDEPYEGLWRCTTIGATEKEQADGFGVCAVRDQRLTVLVGTIAPAGLICAATGTITADQSRLTLEVDAGFVRRPGERTLEAWQPSRWSAVRTDDKLVLSSEGRQIHCVRQGLGLGQSARLDRGALTLSDDRFLLVAASGGSLHAGTGAFYRRGTTFTLMPDRWIAQTDKGFTMAVPPTLAVDATRPVVMLADGTEVKVINPLNPRPPRAPRRGR